MVAVSGDLSISFLQDNKRWTLFWSQPGKQCAVYAGCGAYGLCNQNSVQSCNCLQGFRPKDNEAWDSQEWSAGCVRNTAQDCQDGNSQGFLQLTGISTPPGAISFQRQLTEEDCKKACLSNCSCTAYSQGINNHVQTCQLWFNDLFNLYEDTSNGSPLFVRVASSDLPKSSSTYHKAYIAGAAVGVVVGLVTISAVVFAVLLRRHRSFTKSADNGASAALTIFSYKQLQVATQNFSERLGGGGFGSVFKGTLPDKSLVAVKILEGTGDGQLEKQFRTEVSTLGIIQHVNLVRPRGLCREGLNRLLVYDCMPNGSLNTFLFHESNVLDWKTRFRIALGVARGILYLHEECRDCIIHCDIKPENILLDLDFCPKVADFGLAKLVGREFSNVLTTARGTRGYVAPEWLGGLPITPKADVYSFGMTLFEIIAGRRNIDGDAESSKVFFPAWAVSEMSKGKFMGVVDRRIENDAEGEEVRRAAMAAGWCIQDEEDDRPSMSEVVRILEGTVDVSAPPIPISLQKMEKTSSFLFFWDKSERGNLTNSTST